MVKHIPIIRRLLPTNCLSVFGHLVGLALNGLIRERNFSHMSSTRTRLPSMSDASRRCYFRIIYFVITNKGIDPCLFCRHKENDLIILIVEITVYFNDLLSTGNNNVLALFLLKLRNSFFIGE